MLAAIVVGAVLAAFLLPQLLRRVRGRESEHAVEQRLLRSCMGDRSQVERLVSGEMRRHPGISRARAAARVLESLVRDNR